MRDAGGDHHLLAEGEVLLDSADPHPGRTFKQPEPLLLVGVDVLGGDGPTRVRHELQPQWLVRAGGSKGLPLAGWSA